MGNIFFTPAFDSFETEKKVRFKKFYIETCIDTYKAQEQFNDIFNK